MTPDGEMRIDMSKVTRIPEELEKTADNNQRALFAMLLDKKVGACVEVKFQEFLSEKACEKFVGTSFSGDH